MARVFIGVGANIEPETHIRAALRALAHAMRLTGVSTFYRSPALGSVAQPPFINGVIAAETTAPPLAVKFDILRPLEHAQGRRRSADKYAPRTLDLDLLCYDAVILKTAALILPDPDITARPFLAIPLCELAPDFRLPSGQFICEIAAGMSRDGLEPLPEFTAMLKSEVFGDK